MMENCHANHGVEVTRFKGQIGDGSLSKIAVDAVRDSQRFGRCNQIRPQVDGRNTTAPFCQPYGELAAAATQFEDPLAFKRAEQTEHFAAGGPLLKREIDNLMGIRVGQPLAQLVRPITIPSLLVRERFNCRTGHRKTPFYLIGE